MPPSFKRTFKWQATKLLTEGKGQEEGKGAAFKLTFAICHSHILVMFYYTLSFSRKTIVATIN